MRRVPLSVVVMALAAFAACETKSPTAPPSVVDLDIAGAPAAIASKATAQLTARATLGNGAVKMCPATWTVNDPRVAVVSAAGLLTSGMTGYATITATCAGISAQVRVRVEGPATYQPEIRAQDSDLDLWALVPLPSLIEVLDGPRAGDRIVINKRDDVALRSLPWPVQVRLTVPDYEPTEFVMAESTGDTFIARSGNIVFHVLMRFNATGFSQLHVHQFNSSVGRDVSYPVMVAGPGTLVVRLWFAGDYNESMKIGVRCDGVSLGERLIRFGTMGEVFEFVVPGVACEVQANWSHRTTPRRMRLAITVP